MTRGVLTYASTSSVVIGVASAPTIYLTATLPALRVLTLSSVGAENGFAFHIVRTGGGAPTWDVKTDDSTPVLLKSLAAGTWCDVQHDGTAWRLMAYGAL
jgi:hypothetical protein